MDVEAAQEPKLSCGLIEFRGVELAYLNIGGEQMLSLAQLLSTFFPVTPRTTLFTRMEKIQARRHFCNGAEIKLLKTVGGCHGSSANCTVIPKADVETYCSTYLDPVGPHVKDVKGQVVEQFSNKQDTKSRPRKSMKSPNKNNKALQPLAESSKLVAIQHEHNSSFKSKRKKKIIADRSVSVSFIEDKPQMIINTKTGNSLNEFAANGIKLEDISAGGEIENDHVTNCSTQTPSMLNRILKTKKSPKMNADERSNNRTGVKQRNKRPLSAGSDKEKLYPPPKLHVSETVAAVNSKPLIRQDLEFCHLAVSEVEKIPKLPLHSVVSGVRSPFSDVSSNDSGFSSTTPKKLTSSKNGMESKLDEVIPKTKKPLLLKKDSPVSKAKSSPRKEMEKELVTVEENASLSPPALVIRRCENTWQVETKTNKVIVENVRKKLKLGKSTKLKARVASKKKTTDKVITEKKAIEISNADLSDQNDVSSQQQEENKLVKRNIPPKVAVNDNAEQMECQSKNQEVLSVVNEETPCVDEVCCEEPLKDRGIFPMKRRRRRRSKLEMQELRLRQAAKKAAKLAGHPISIPTGTDQNMNSVTKVLKLKKKRKKKTVGKKIGIEKKSSESTEMNSSQPEIASLANVNNVKAKIESVTLSDESMGMGTFTDSPQAQTRELTDPENRTAQTKRSKIESPSKLVPVKSALKTNSKFRLNDLFSGFPMLTVQNGSICPAYSHVYPAETKPPGPDHVVWKWQLGCPVVDKAMDKVQDKVHKIRKRKSDMNASNSVVAKARACKAKKLSKAKSKISSSTKPAMTISATSSDTKFRCVCVAETNETPLVDAADSSTNIDVTDKLQSCQPSCASTPVMSQSSPHKSLSLYSPVHPGSVVTPSSLVTGEPAINIIDFADNVPSSTITCPPQPIAAEG